MSEVSLVEVVMFKFKKDDKEDAYFLDNEFDLSYPHWEDCVNDIPEDKQEANPFDRNDIIFTQDCYCFAFRFFGQTFDYSYASGLDFEFTEGYLGEMFEGWEEDFIKYGEQLIGLQQEKQKDLLERDANYKMTRFITVWEYTAFQDSYSGEFEAEWDLLGLLEMHKIRDLLIKEN